MVVLELYYKSAPELAKLAETVILPLHKRVGVSRVLLTFKGRESARENPVSAAALRRRLPKGIDVSAVWSAKAARVGTGKRARGAYASREEATLAGFERYIEDMTSAGASSILVVSGVLAGKADVLDKGSLDSVTTLTSAAESSKASVVGVQSKDKSAGRMTFGCCFNPHVGGGLDPAVNGEARFEKEWNRFERKIETGAVSEAWVAFGADVDALERGLKRIKALREDRRAPPHLRVFGSIFVPSKSWIAKMRFRCWKGTFLGGKDDANGYLCQTLAPAQAVTRRTLELFEEYEVEPVIESSIRTPREMEQAIAMLGL
jgi:hypothetical protein